MSCDISPLPSALFTLMFCHPLKFNRSKVKFFIFFSKLFYPPDFPISLSEQSSRKHILGILAFVLHCLLSDMNCLRSSLFVQLFPRPSHFILCHLLSGLRWCTPSPLAYLSFLSRFNLFCDHCHINLP